MLNSPITDSVAVPCFSVGQTVLVALLRRAGDTVICNPTAKIVAAVGQNNLSFKDGKDQLIDKCFANTQEGMQECLNWCEQVKSFQEAFGWPIRTPPS